MKPAISYAVCRKQWGRRFRVIAVTSEKGGQVYGRDEDGSVTHIRARDVLCWFDDEPTAKAANERADKKAAELRPGVEAAHAEYNRLVSERDKAILAAAKEGSNA